MRSGGHDLGVQSQDFANTMWVCTKLEIHDVEQLETVRRRVGGQIWEFTPEKNLASIVWRLRRWGGMM